MTEIKLCSVVMPETENTFVIVCDLQRGHRGPHQATVLWGDEDGVRGEVEDG